MRRDDVGRMRAAARRLAHDGGAVPDAARRMKPRAIGTDHGLQSPVRFATSTSFVDGPEPLDVTSTR